MTVDRSDLTAEQAQEALKAFLREQRDAFPALVVASFMLDYTQASVTLALRHIATEIAAGRIGAAEQLHWFERLGFYLGESLRHNRRGLSWAVGSPRQDHENLPVIRGFADGGEADVIAICENVIYTVVTRAVPLTRVDQTVDAWFAKPVPGED
jgi:hypothetical protein